MGESKLSKLREKRVLSQIILDQVTKETGIDQGRLSRIERGFAEPTEDEKKLLAGYYGCTVEEIF